MLILKVYVNMVSKFVKSDLILILGNIFLKPGYGQME